MSLPEAIIRHVKRLDIDLESLIVDFLLRGLKFDPLDEAEVRFEFATKYFEEAKHYLKKRYSIQASEKTKSFGRWFT